MEKSNYKDLLAKKEQNQKKFNILLNRRKNIDDELKQIEQEQSKIEEIINDQSALTVKPGEIYKRSQDYGDIWLIAEEQAPSECFCKCLLVMIYKNRSRIDIYETTTIIRKGIDEECARHDFECAFSEFNSTSRKIVNQALYKSKE